MPDDPSVETVADGVARVRWTHAGTDVVRATVEDALSTHGRVEAHVGVDDVAGQRTATWSGLRKEGVRRGVAGDEVVYARLDSDASVGEPDGFRALLNSFLPRKRAIAQMLVRDDRGRVLLCRLTYKRDWDLPGGVVEVGESPQLAVVREVAEELALDLEARSLLLTDWLPPWGGWDDALCLVFDGGVHDPSVLDRVVRQEREIRDVAFCDPAEVEERCADFTARRVRAALEALDAGTSYTESGRG
ncbi:NUDIX hydrolase [Nocardioides sp. CFH 31398]|uniref:NUDIX domain-containing protein n=1 Tax=Nocardioides sp. CFH 31398 TaxID=2919579 RepID=UPI001F056913|nr:NUDIX hydrolase [Nocardioides sp. CFH 31398]MCH1868379.1 NUDIX hydrolase [Nocardioides sp. CFH 31398]